jgi:signal transduction histidine kinase
MFKRLLVTYLSILIVAIVVLSLALTFIYRGYAFSEKRRMLKNAAYDVNQQLEDWTEGKISQKELNQTVDSAGYITDSKIYVVRLEKEAFENAESFTLGEDLEEKYLIEDLGRILDGETVFRRDQYSSKFGMRVVFSGVPWTGTDGISGAILMFSPVNEINRNANKMNLVIWATAFGFIMLGGFIILITSQRISRPVKEMELAARKLAAGEIAEDIHTITEDEIGQLAETEEIRSSFIANVSHDLRTPLTSINGFVEGMLDGIIKIEDYPKYLKIIKSETGRLNRLTSDILQTAKIQSGKIELNKQYIHASEMFVSVVEKMKKLAEEKSISITVECDEETIVHADGDRLYQVLDNVIGNAIKYTEIGGGIRLKAMYVGSGVEFSISDTGEGISEENLLHIFERFYRTDKSRSSVNGGSGLGLSIAKNLVELHGGSIRAESIQGDGTTIIFDIPK